LARVLIVGCGCRGRELAAALIADGQAVRGTTRDRARLSRIAAAGAEPAVADPDRLSTLLPHIEGISAVCWLMGTAPSPPLHGPRLQSMLEKIVDTPVRGLVYEAAGPVDDALLERGAALVRAAAATYRMPVGVVEQDPADPVAWLAVTRRAVADVLAP
jgi:hypothetical protein